MALKRGLLVTRILLQRQVDGTVGLSTFVTYVSPSNFPIIFSPNLPQSLFLFFTRYGRLVAHRGESGSWVFEFYQRLLPLEYGVMNLPTWGICFRKQVVETSYLMWDVEVMSSMPWMPLLWGRDARLSMAEDEGLDFVCQTVMYKKKQTDRVFCP